MQTDIYESNELIIHVNRQSAELYSLVSKLTGLEYIWQADKQWWGRHAPVLFPIVGKLKNDRYLFNQKYYSLPQHGFARDLTFSNAEGSCYYLRSSPETMAVYPFRFELKITYTVTDRLAIRYDIINPSETETLFYSIGAHPAFRCPMLADEKFEDYFIEFNRPVKGPRHLLDKGLFTGETETLPLDGEKLPLSYALFEKDAIVLMNEEADIISLRSRNHPHSVIMDMPGFDYLGIWTKPGAPFLCLEPWNGLADYQDTTGQLTEKKGICHLPPGGQSSYSFGIRVS